MNVPAARSSEVADVPGPPPVPPPLPAALLSPAPLPSSPVPLAPPPLSSSVAPPRAAPPIAAEALPAAYSTVVRRWLRSTPSWLASSVVHLLALVVLAWLAVEETRRPPPTLVLAATVAEDYGEVEETFVQELEMTGAADVAAPQVASLGPTESSAPVLDTSLAGDESVPLEPAVGSSLASIDALFAPGGGAWRSSGDGPAKKEALFYGVRARGNRFVFIVDSSNSMRGSKFAEAKRELLYSLRRLGKDQYFYVIFFDADAERMVLEPTDGVFQDPAPTLVPATVDNLNKVERWVHSVQNELKTNPFEAVKFALEQSPDAIFLLTDGQFTDKGRTVRYLARENFVRDDLGRRQVKTAVNTIGFYSRDGETVLKDLARDYRGTYQFVAPPGGR